MIKAEVRQMSCTVSTYVNYSRDKQMFGIAEVRQMFGMAEVRQMFGIAGMRCICAFRIMLVGKVST